MSRVERRPAEAVLGREPLPAPVRVDPPGTAASRGPGRGPVEPGTRAAARSGAQRRPVAIAADAIAGDTIAEDANAGDTIAEDANAGDTIAEDANAGDTIAEDANAGDTIAEDANAGDTIAEDANAGDTIAEDAIAGDTIAEDAIAGDTVADDAVADDPFADGPFADDVVVIGGCGHVGLPLGIALAGSGLRVTLYDVNGTSVAAVNAAGLPFREDGAQPLLREIVADGRLRAVTDPACVARAEHVVVVIGTPVDEHLNPDLQALPLALREAADHLVDGQVLILRSTVYPGVTALVERLVAGLGRAVDVAFCPERIAEGRAMTELYDLPQIVAARSARARERAAALFSHVTPRTVALEPEEAELAKLFTNVWRYVKFATANQFFMIANDYGLDFARIRDAMRDGYPRAQDLPAAGFAAGPCLFKDTMQLAAFSNNTFALGHAAMLVNEGLPLYLVSRLERRFPLDRTRVGILGMAFKGDSDDTRASLAYKLRRILDFKSAGVLCTDPHVTTDDRLVRLDAAIEGSDVLVVAAPHGEYRELRTDKPVVDVWNLLGNGVRV